MNNCPIHERSKNIPIPQISPTKKNTLCNLHEYSLTHNFFDPTKSSPPNNFLLKLKLRMLHYETFNREDNFTSE